MDIHVSYHRDDEDSPPLESSTDQNQQEQPPNSNKSTVPVSGEDASVQSDSKEIDKQVDGSTSEKEVSASLSTREDVAEKNETDAEQPRPSIQPSEQAPTELEAEDKKEPISLYGAPAGNVAETQQEESSASNKTEEHPSQTNDRPTEDPTGTSSSTEH